jgi:hypothetical protein
MTIPDEPDSQIRNVLPHQIAEKVVAMAEYAYSTKHFPQSCIECDRIAAENRCMPKRPIERSSMIYVLLFSQEMMKSVQQYR